jgi:hypothetical protein
VSDKETKLNLPISLESFTRGLLSTTCLTVVCGSGAVAGTVTEPLTAFPNTSPGILLPTGTTVVNGFIGYKPSEAGFAGTDWFEFQGLTPGSSYTLSAAYNPLGSRTTSGNGESGGTLEGGLTRTPVALNLFNSAQTLLATQSMENAGAVVSGTVPGDGVLDVEITAPAYGYEGNFAAAGGSFYQVSFAGETGSSGSSAPEPGTLAPVGLALAGALAWSRKRRK